MSNTSSSRKRKLGSSENVLENVCVCLTGFTAAEKNKLHSKVSKLGGRFLRHFTEETTHLIADRPEGEKFNQAKKFHVEIVTSKWIEACELKQEKVPSETYRLITSSKGTNRKLCPSIKLKLQEVSSINQDFSPLFSKCCFFLVGFEDYLDIKDMLGKVIRKYMGTILWKPNRMITHVIVNDGCGSATRNDVSNFCRHHPNSPVAVSPQWIISCIQTRNLVDSSAHKPRKTIPMTKMMTKKHASTPKTTNKRKQIFKGCFFSIQSSHPRLWMPTVNVVNDEKDVEVRMIALGAELIKDEISQLQNKGIQQSTPIKCYIIHLNGPFDSTNYLDTNPFLKDMVNKKMCTAITVNEIWLKTCESCNSVVDPNICRSIFTPQPLSIRKLQNDNNLKVAVTGFTGAMRDGIRQCLITIGAVYTDSMSMENTHLICKEATGLKYNKAVEWSLHVVKKEWLFHIMKYGYEIGCERQFSL